MKKFLQFLKFAIFSASAGAIESGVYAIMYSALKIPYWPSYLTGLILSVLWNFTLNRKFTFGSASNIPVAMLKVAVYYAIFTPVSTVGGNYLEDNLHWNGYLVLVICMLVNFITEFFYQKHYVFRDSLKNEN